MLVVPETWKTHGSQWVGSRDEFHSEQDAENFYPLKDF